MKRQIKVKAVLVTMGILFGLFSGAKDMRYVSAIEDAAAIQLPDEDIAQPEGGISISELSQLMTADEDIDMKTDPSGSAETIMSYKAGDSVFVTGETANGWYRAIYQDKEGYIPKDSLNILELDVAALDEEMARTEQEAELVVETVERYHAEARRSRIWGSVIVVLVVGIFATGIISGIKSAKGKDEQEA